MLTHFFEKSKIPDVLMLIIVGIILGPVTEIMPAERIGIVGNLFTQFALIIILFEGGLNIELRNLIKTAQASVTLTVTFFFISAIVIALIMHLGFDYSPMASTLTGFICGGTSSAVVIPLLGMIRVSKKASAMMVVESALTDVLCIAFALGELQSIDSGAFKVGNIIYTLISSLVVAALVGIVFGFIWIRIISWIRTFDNTQFATCFFMFIVFGVTEMLGFSGAIAALTFGVILGNAQTLSNHAQRLLGNFLPVGVVSDAEKKLYKELVFLVKIFFFLYIGISIPFENTNVIIVALCIVCALFLLRPLAARFLVGRKTSAHDKTVISVMIPKGLAAAVLAGLPSQYGMVEGADIQAITYHVVLSSIVITSVLIPLIESTKLGTLSARFFASSSVSEEEAKDEDRDDRIIFHTN